MKYLAAALLLLTMADAHSASADGRLWRGLTRICVSAPGQIVQCQTYAMRLLFESEGRCQYETALAGRRAKATLEHAFPKGVTVLVETACLVQRGAYDA